MSSSIRLTISEAVLGKVSVFLALIAVQTPGRHIVVPEVIGATAFASHVVGSKAVRSRLASLGLGSTASTDSAESVAPSLGFSPCASARAERVCRGGCRHVLAVTFLLRQHHLLLCVKRAPLSRPFLFDADHARPVICWL